MPRKCEPETCQELHICSTCKEPRPCTDYYRRKTAPKAGRDRRGERVTVCRRCASSQRNKYRDSDPERNRAYMRQWRFGVTQEQYDAMLDAQGGACLLCRTTEPRGKGVFHVDHDHSCCPGQKTCGNCNRGLLCAACNTALGQFKDDPEVMRRAALYVEGKL